MIFSSVFFVFAFLPAVLLGYYLLKPFRNVQNVWLVIVSLFFYAWGEPRVVFIMIASILINYIFGLLVGRNRHNRAVSTVIILLTLLCNLSVLFVFKYLKFVLTTLGADTSTFTISLPIGISFYTFQAISYVIDVYRGNGEAQKNPLNVALYIAFFPQLIAGPIVRYQTIAEQIKNRRESMKDFSAGVQRFIIGLSKKLILANSFAPVADHLFGHVAQLSGGSAWLGAVCYTFQIYFDFSGYSDMAIGMGKMFGFRFLDNFDYPYISGSVTEFWRRWHISLGSWFRDYVYFPLGGSHVKHRSRLMFNLFVVWTLTGIWHGANWTFLLWGWWYLVILIFEKLTGIHKKVRGTWAEPFYRVFTLFCVVAGWVLFRADSLGEAFLYLKTMFFVKVPVADPMFVFMLKDIAFLLVLGAVASTPAMKRIGERLEKSRLRPVFCLAQGAGYLLLFGVCIGYMVSSSYNPFIYFNF